MSEHTGDGQRGAKGRDPVLRFLGGCAVVASVVVILVLGSAWYVARRLSRDPAAGRPPEAFLTGAESRYWCLALKPDDAGLQALFRSVDASGEEARRKAWKGTFLESFPLPRRRAQLAQLAPLTLEGSLFDDPRGWAVRGTFSHQVLRMRAALTVMRWTMSHKTNLAKTVDIDGVTVTQVNDNHVAFELANVANRVLVASDESRMRAVLAAAKEERHAAIFALHREVALDGEDGWAFITNSRIGDFPDPLSIDAAVASFSVDPNDELVFRVAVSDTAAVPEGRPFRGTLDECKAVTAEFLPIFDAATIEIDAAANPPVDGRRVFTGRVRDLTKRLPDLPKRMGEIIVRSTGSGPQTPSASPIPPSPPSSAGPRSDIPAAPKREGSPKPPR